MSKNAHKAIGLKLPFVMTHSYYKSSKVNQSKNVAHINYIIRSQAVCLSNEINSPMESAYDLEKEISIDDRGLLDKDGLADPDMVKDELSQHEGIVHRFVLSISGDDAVTLGYTGRDKWAESIRNTMYDASQKMGIDYNNLNYYFAMHDNTDNPHVHMIVFEKNPILKEGHIRPSKLNEIKGVFINEFYKEYQFELVEQKNLLREGILDYAKDMTMDALAKFEIEIEKQKKAFDLISASKGNIDVGLAPKLSKEIIKQYSVKLKELSSILPTKGRIAYKYMPDNVKQKVEDITEWFMKQPETYKSIQEYMENAENLAKKYNNNPENIKSVRQNAFDDLKTRHRNLILKGAVQASKSNGFKVDFEKAKLLGTELSSINGVKVDIELIVKKEIISKAIAEFKKVNFTQSEIIHFAKMLSKNLDIEITEKELKVLNNKINFSHEIDKKSLTLLLKTIGISENDINVYLIKKAFCSEKEANALIKTCDSPKSIISFKEYEEICKALSIPQGKPNGMTYPWQITEIFREVSEEDTKGFCELVKRSGFNLEKINFEIKNVLKDGFTDEIYKNTKYISTNDSINLDREINDLCNRLKATFFDHSLNRNEIMRDWSEKNKIDISVLEKCMNVSVNKVDKEIQSVSIKLGRSVEQMDVSHDKISGILLDWGSKNNIDQGILEQSLEIISNNKSVKAIREQDWENINSILNIEMKYPYTDYDSLRSVNHMDLDKLINQIKSSSLNGYSSITNEKIISNCEKLINNKDDQVTRLQSSLHIADPMAKTLENFAKLLITTGKNEREALEIIKDWQMRSGNRLSHETTSKIVENSYKTVTELRSWGREFSMPKDNFGSLLKNLGVSSKKINDLYIWKGGDQQETFQQISKGIMKGLLSSIENSMKQTQAEGERLRQSTMQRNQKIAEQLNKKRNQEREI